MKKVILIVFIILTMLLCSCLAQETDKENGTEKDQDITTEEQTQSTVYESFEKELNNRGFEFETVAMAAQMVGAKSGIKYIFGDEKVELYEFDIESDAYKEALAEQSLKSDFGDFPAAVKGGFAVISDNEEILEIFNSIIK